MSYNFCNHNIFISLKIAMIFKVDKIIAPLCIRYRKDTNKQIESFGQLVTAYSTTLEICWTQPARRVRGWSKQADEVSERAEWPGGVSGQSERVSEWVNKWVSSIAPLDRTRDDQNNDNDIFLNKNFQIGLFVETSQLVGHVETK